MARIIGIDPGLGKMGWGVLDFENTRLLHVAHGVFSTKAGPFIGDRLLHLHNCLGDLIKEFSPKAMAIEQPFVFKDPSAALKLGYARAAALISASQAGLEVGEYTPNLVKKSVVGHGHATKEQILFMVRRLLPTAKVTQPDAGDALAIAITHAHLRRELQIKK